MLTLTNQIFEQITKILTQKTKILINLDKKNQNFDKFWPDKQNFDKFWPNDQHLTFKEQNFDEKLTFFWKFNINFDQKTKMLTLTNQKFDKFD